MPDFKHNYLDFHSIDGVICDMDGVLWRGAELLPGTPEFFQYLAQQGIPYALATNNSSKQSDEYLARLTSIGIDIPAERIITSGKVTLEVIKRSYAVGTPLYIIGSDTLKALFTDNGYIIDPDQAVVVIVGLDVTLTYEKLRIAGLRLHRGAEFIGTNGDVSLPVLEGIAPGNGSVLAALSAMTGRIPRLMGKPEAIMFQLACEQMGTDPARTLMVGDRLDTDIEGALRAGLRAAVVLSGVSTREEIANTKVAPDAVYDNLAALLTAWEAAHQD